MPHKSRFSLNPRRWPRWVGSAMFTVAFGLNAFNFALPLGFRICCIALMVFCLYRCTRIIHAQHAAEHANVRDADLGNATSETPDGGK